jgi:hypothetical protein
VRARRGARPCSRAAGSASARRRCCSDRDGTR